MKKIKHSQNYSMPIKGAVNILAKHLEIIPNVTAWAEHMGYTQNYFSILFNEHFGESPSEYLCRIRYRHLHKHILRDPNGSVQTAASRIRFPNDRELNTFLAEHYNTSFAEVRAKLTGNSTIMNQQSIFGKADHMSLVVKA